MAPTHTPGGSARHSGDSSARDADVEPALSSADIDTASIDTIGAVSQRATVSVQLPATVIHDIPEDEQAVAIDDVAVQPDYLEAAAESSTRSQRRCPAPKPHRRV
jgi:hypothetical protein